MRSEGWLSVKLPGAQRADRRYVVFEGYVLRIFADEPTLKQHPALHLLDLRMIEALTPEDIFSPAGPCQLHAKGSTPSKSVTLAPDTQIASDADYDWWLPMVASAVPDRAVAPSLRGRFRIADIVLALMKAHGTQLSAHKLSDKAWRKQQLAKELHLRNSPSTLKAARGSSGNAAGGKNVGSLLERARLERSRQPEEDHTDRAAEEVPVTAQGVVTPPTDTITKLDAKRGMAGSDGSLQVSATGTGTGTGGSISNTLSGRVEGSDGLEVCVNAGTAQESAEVQSAGHPPSWWFIKHENGLVGGPHGAAEMRRRYQRGAVSHSTIVCFLPYEERPADDEHVSQPFVVLQELCTAAGPPFMEGLPPMSHPPRRLASGRI